MKDKLIMGRYLPLDSWMHQLDPRTKFIATFVYIGMTLLAQSTLHYLLLIGILLLEIILSRIPFSQFMRGVRPMLSLLLFTALIQLIFQSGSTVLFSLGWLTITREGVRMAVFTFLRFSLILMKSLMLTLTTEPLNLTNALDYFLTPFKRFGTFIAEIPLMLAIGIRFIPSLLDEAEIILDAQRLRGMDFTEGNWVERLKKYIPILIPLFNRSYERAFDLAMAMDARDYRGGASRSHYYPLRFSRHDGMMGLLYILWLLLFYLL
ncbi:energy-coupling factor transporter transmembrane protein EcfT [Aerococcaceae bacterium DSM 111020]|nr:energy-coupling factor transporter transmembrane protein EcfT [Aerococcaceae bacterium DSM 111020]